MLVEKFAGLRFDGSLVCGSVLVPDRVAAEELSPPDEPHPASAGSRMAIPAIAAPTRLIARALIQCLRDQCVGFPFGCLVIA